MLARRASITASHDAAVHVPDRAGHPARLVGEREDNSLCDILRRADAANGVKAVETLHRAMHFGFRNETLADRGFDHGWRHGIDADVLGAGASSIARCWIRFAVSADTRPSAANSLGASPVLSGRLPTITALPPCASTSRAVSLPMPLVPSATSSLWPLN